MPAASRDFSWMRLVLAALFREVSDGDVFMYLRDAQSREVLRTNLNAIELAGGRLGHIPEGDYGDNLLQAILALRVKFPEDEATAKLETNIAMRERRR
jgi:hypothetical protein